jgi:hypothetical protein
MKGFLNANANEQVFILATQDNTDIFIDGNGTPAATINTGQTFAYPITNASTYINTTQPVYVLHASGLVANWHRRYCHPLTVQVHSRFTLYVLLPSSLA